jgi:hypothetical protein
VQSDDSHGTVNLEGITKGLVSGDNAMAFLAADPAAPVDPPANTPPEIDSAPMVQVDLYTPPPTASAVLPDEHVYASMADPSTFDPQMMVAGLQCQPS